ncbi:MAG: hypothetical protein UE295_08265, partial [Acutalibacteraceae bacterium]|nr:hypothetical protein [Acutalibacteraceae bacterium]
MNDFKEFNNSQNNNSNGWGSSFNTDSYGNQSGWNNSDNNSYNSNNGYCVNPQNSTNQSNIYNSPNYNQYNNQQGVYNSGYNGSNQNGFYNQSYNGNGYDNPGFNAQTDSQKGFLKQFKNLAIEIQRVSQAAKSNSLYGIPQGAEVISIKEEIDFKTPVLIILLIFLGLTSFDLFQTFSKGVNADEISAYIFG